MHTGRRYTTLQTLNWSRQQFLVPAAWATIVTLPYVLLDWHWLAVPWVPISVIGVAVAFYLGFKNKESYDRLWEGRKIYGAIVNASRTWAFSTRDLMAADAGASTEPIEPEELARIHGRLVHRHVAWMDALRHQLRKPKPWEHHGPYFDSFRQKAGPVEGKEDVREVLQPNLSSEELGDVLAQINPAAHLLAAQSADLASLRRRGLLDGFGHTFLQQLLEELMTQQGRAERIKNFPFPRQYATVNTLFAWCFSCLVPFGMLHTFAGSGDQLIWLAIPFSTLVSWVFLTTDRIGDWSENPFEGLANDVPITSMSRGIERDIRQMAGETELPPPREQQGDIQF